MPNQAKTKSQLQAELNELRCRVAELEAAAERRPAETETAPGDAWYRLIFETTPQGIWQVDPQGTILAANPGIARMLGCPPAELVGRSLFDFIDEADLPQARADFMRRKQGRPEQVEARLRRKDGAPLWVLLMSAPVMSDQGEFLFGIGMFTDITARQQAEQALRESRERLELVLEGAELGMWDWHIPSGQTVFNERWAAMLGYSLAEVESRLSVWKNLVHPDDQARVSEALQAHLAGQTPLYQTEHRVQTKTGEWKWILDIGKVQERDAQGQPVRARGIHQDITQRKTAEETLRRYQEIVSTTSDWMSLVDRNYIYRIVNQSYLTLNNKTFDEIIGHSVAELTGQTVFETLIKPHFDQVLAGETVHYQAWFDFVSAGRRFNDVTYLPYREADGTISGIVVSGRDITEAKLLEERLRRVEKMEAVGQLAAGLAHHYNNMLTTIIGYTSLALHRLPPTDPLTTYLKPVLATAEQAAALVRQIQAFARKQLLQPKTVSLNELILKLQPELKQKLPAPVELVTYLAPDLSQVQVDPGQFEHLLLSLTTNAGEAMPRGGQLTLTTRNVSLGLVEAELYELPPGDYVLLTVKDTGRGLSDTVKAHLFEPFFTTKPVGQGTGLSLAMALGIAKQHGGHLLAESQPGQGAIFMLYLPCLASLANPAAE